MGGKLVVTLIVVGLIWAFWRRKNPAPAANGGVGRFIRALGAAKAAMQHSAEQRTGPEQPMPPPRSTPREPIELVRCPKCGGYAPAGQRCTCS